MKKQLILTLLSLTLMIILVSCRNPSDNDVSVSASVIEAYQCSNNGDIQQCPLGLSGGLHTRCYYLDELSDKVWFYCKQGWSEYQPVDVLEPTEGRYHCYPGKGYCRLKGLLTNPQVPIGEVVG